MPAEDRDESGQAGAQDAPPGRAADGTAAGGRRWTDELLLSSELVALAAFTFSRPVLDTFGRSPATFILRGVTGWWVVAFGLIVATVPALAVTAVGTGARRLGGRRRCDVVHAVLVGLVGGIGAWRLGHEITGWPGDATKLLLLGPLVGLALAAARRWMTPTRTFLRVAGAASVVYLVLFLVSSPTSNLIAAALPTTPEVESADIADQLGDDPPDVMVLVFDELPLQSLLDGAGHVDGELYPHFASLEADATWYRNHTTVAGFTYDAVPALVTGRYPDPEGGFLTPDDDPENLFTLLAGSYQVHASEHATTLCPASVCPPHRNVQLGSMLEEAVDTWIPGATEGAFGSEGLPEEAADAERRVDELDLRPGERPHLVVHHIALPHQPWRLDAGGTAYEASNPPSGLHLTGWTGWGQDVGRQRHVLQLQATDRLLGRYLDALREAGTYDDTLVAVTADHGAAFGGDGASPRALSRDNYDQIMWTPLFVKAPGQAEGAIDDRDVRSIDLLPTLADLLGVEVPWSVDGEVVGAAADRDGATKPYVATASDDWQPAEGERFVEVDARTGFARVLAADPVEWEGEDAVWKRTAHGDLVGREIDDLRVGEDADRPVVLRDTGLDDVDVDEPLPIEVVGSTRLPEGAVVAVALNGVVGAVGEVEALPPDRVGGGLPHRIISLVLPRLIVQGDNDVGLFVVEGQVGGEVLHPVPLDGA